MINCPESFPHLLSWIVRGTLLWNASSSCSIEKYPTPMESSDESRPCLPSSSKTSNLNLSPFLGSSIPFKTNFLQTGFKLSLIVSDDLRGFHPPGTGLEITRYGSDLEKKSLFANLCPLTPIVKVSIFHLYEKHLLIFKETNS